MARQALVILIVVIAFGILVPIYKGFGFLDPRIIAAYACLALLFVAPASAELAARTEKAPGSGILGRIGIIVAWGWGHHGSHSRHCPGDAECGEPAGRVCSRLRWNLSPRFCFQPERVDCDCDAGRGSGGPIFGGGREEHSANGLPGHSAGFGVRIACAAGKMYTLAIFDRFNTRSALTASGLGVVGVSRDRGSYALSSASLALACLLRYL